MARTTSRPVELPNDRRGRNTLVALGLGIIILFAILGVVSAGIFLGSKVAGGSSPSARRHVGTSASRVAVQDIARAQAQATRIVRDAQGTGRTVVKRETSKARKQASAIIARARRRAATIASSTAPVAAAPAPTASAPYTQPSASGPTTASGSLPANLGTLPASWLVVGYNATFGSGPGSAGSITVTNRGNKRFSGLARVVYARGGQATAAFGGLGPGQTKVLALNGPAYRGGGYSISVSVG